MAKRDYDHLFKLVIIGDSGVGKSNLLLRYADNEFIESFISTIGVDFRFKNIAVADKRIKLQIWDTAGQERFRTITNTYYRSADGVVMVYDVTNRESFEHVRGWLKEASQHAPPGFCKMLVGNKSDRTDRAVPEAEGRALAEELHMPFLETSARTADNVEAAFLKMSEQLVHARAAAEREEAAEKLDVTKPTKTTGGGGCKCG